MQKSIISRISYQNAEFEGEILQNKPHGRGFSLFSSGNSYYGKSKNRIFHKFLHLLKKLR